MEDEHSSLGQKYTELAITFSEADFTDRYAWVETIDQPELVHKLKQLTPHELEILTLLAFDGYTQKEAAERMGIPYRTFKYQLQKIKIFLQ